MDFHFPIKNSENQIYKKLKKGKKTTDINIIIYNMCAIIIIKIIRILSNTNKLYKDFKMRMSCKCKRLNL